MWYTLWMLLSFGMLETAKSSTRKMCSFHQICITIIWSLEYANNLGEIRQLQIGNVWNSSTNLPNFSSNWGRFNQVNVGKDHSYNNFISLYKLRTMNLHYMLCYIVRTSVRHQINLDETADLDPLLLCTSYDILRRKTAAKIPRKIKRSKYIVKVAVQRLTQRLYEFYLLLLFDVFGFLWILLCKNCNSFLYTYKTLNLGQRDNNIIISNDLIKQQLNSSIMYSLT